MTKRTREMIEKARALTTEVERGRKASTERVRLWARLKSSGLTIQEIADAVGEQYKTIDTAIRRAEAAAA